MGFGDKLEFQLVQWFEKRGIAAERRASQEYGISSLDCIGKRWIYRQQSQHDPLEFMLRVRSNHWHYGYNEQLLWFKRRYLCGSTDDWHYAVLRGQPTVEDLKVNQATWWQDLEADVKTLVG